MRRLAVVLVVLVVAAAGALAWLVVRSGDAAPTVTAADSSDAVVASAGDGAQAREAASEAAERAYAYSWRTLADDKAAARELMTGPMRRRYDRTMAGTTTTSRRDRTEVRAEVAGSALVSVSDRWARVLLFVNQRTSGDDLDTPRLDLDRVLVTLERVDGAWLVSELDAL